MNRRIWLVILAVVLALGGTLAVYSYAHNADQRAIDNTRAAKVLIVKKAIPAGLSWADARDGGYFSSENVPVRSAPLSAVADTNAAIRGTDVATASIASGQILVREMFGAHTPTTGILPIPKGLLAVSASLPKNADVAGFVQAGAVVAVFHTFKLKGSSVRARGITGDDLTATKLLLARVQVLAVSQDAPSDLNGAKNDSSNNNNSSENVLVTMAMSQKDAERLILAQDTGDLYLGLLSQSSVTDANDGGVVNLVILPHLGPIYVK